MPDGKMDPFPQAVGHLNDWYYTYFLNARLAPAAHFPVYQRDLFKTSGFLVNYGSKAHDIGGLDRNDRHRSPYRLMAASRLMTSARAPQTLWRDEQPNPRTGTQRAFERARVIWPLFAYRGRGRRIDPGPAIPPADRKQIKR